jgi:hypothetical protein
MLSKNIPVVLQVQGPRFGRLDPIPSGDSEAGSSRPQTPSRGSEYGSPPGSPEVRSCNLSSPWLC